MAIKISSDIAKCPPRDKTAPKLRTTILKWDHLTSNVCFHALPSCPAKVSCLLSSFTCLLYVFWLTLQTIYNAKYMISETAPGQQPQQHQHTQCLQAREGRLQAESLHCIKSHEKQFPRTAGQQALVPQLAIHMKCSSQEQLTRTNHLCLKAQSAFSGQQHTI